MNKIIDLLKKLSIIIRKNMLEFGRNFKKEFLLLPLKSLVFLSPGIIINSFRQN